MSEKKNSNSHAVAIDTGILIEILEDSKLGQLFFKNVLQNPKFERFYINPLTDTELKYIFCRREGNEFAKRTVNSLLKDFIICSESNLRNEAFRFKCEFPISLADSYSLAVANILKIPLCMKKDEEIQKNLKELSNYVDFVFVDDI